MMTREETIKSIAKTIHRVEFPNSACWVSCNKCSYNGNCDYLKAAEIVYQQYVEQAEIEIARNVFADIRNLFSRLFNGDIKCQQFNVDFLELMKKYKVEESTND